MPTIEEHRKSAMAAEEARRSCLDPSRSLFVFRLDNCLRAALLKVINSKPFFLLILVAIVLNALASAADMPRYTNPLWLQQTIYWTEIVLCGVFSLEMVVKIVALGLVLHKGAYVRSGWNCFDGAMTILTVVSLLMNLQNIAVLRTFRVLRSLRTIGHVKQLRQLLNTLAQAIPSVATSLMLLAWFILVFAILGLQVCGGGTLSQRCYEDLNAGSGGAANYSLARGVDHGCGGYLACPNGTVCMVIRAQHDEYPLTYDDIGQSVLMTLKLVAIDNWNHELATTSSTCGEDKIAMLIVVTLIGGFVLMNVFLAILMNEYARVSNKARAKRDALKKKRAAKQEQDRQWNALPVVTEHSGDDDDEREMLETVGTFEMSGKEQTLSASSNGNDRSPKSALKSPKGGYTGGNADKYVIGGGGGDEYAIGGLDESYNGGDSAVGVTPSNGRGRLGHSVVFAIPPDEMGGGGGGGSSGGGLDSTQGDLFRTNGLLSTTGQNSFGGGSSTRRRSTMGNSKQFSSFFCANGGITPKGRASASRLKYDVEDEVSDCSEGDSDDETPEAAAAAASDRRKSSLFKGGFDDPSDDEDDELDCASDSSEDDEDDGDAPGLFVTNPDGVAKSRGTRHDALDGTDELIDDRDDELTCREKMQPGVEVFSQVMLIVTMINLVFLAMDHYRIDPTWEYVNNMVSLVCTGLFIVELGLKVIAFGFVRTFKEKMNVFDGFLIVASIVEYLVAATTVLSSLKVLRLLRALKIFRVTRRAKSLHILVSALEPSIVPGLFVLLLILIFIFIYAVIGMQLFGNWKFGALRVRFDTVWDAMIAGFIIVTGDNWNDMMVVAMQIPDDYSVLVAVAFFVSLLFIGRYIMVNLFGAVIVDHLERAAQNEWALSRAAAVIQFDEAALPPRLLLPSMANNVALARAHRALTSPSSPCPLSAEDSAAMLNFSGEIAEEDYSLKHRLPGFYTTAFYRLHVTRVLQGHSLLVFSPANPLRRLVAFVVLSTAFRAAAALVTLANLVFIANTTPYTEQQYNVLDDWYELANVCCVAFYGLEFLLEVIARGGVSPQEDVPKFVDGSDVGGLGEREDIIASAYFAAPERVTNFVLLVLGVVGIFVPQVRIIDSLRVFRLAMSVPILRLLVWSLMQTIPPVLQALFLCLIFWSIFAVFGVSLFKGAFYECNDRTVPTEALCVGLYPVAATYEVPAHNAKRYWEQFVTNFDSYPQAMFSMFVVAIGEQWTKVMYQGIDSRGPEQGPSENHREWVAVYFIFFVVIGNFFTLNVLMGVLITFFIRAKHVQDGTMMLSREQRTFMLTKRVIDATMFEFDPLCPKNCIRAFAFALTTFSAAECCKPDFGNARAKRDRDEWKATRRRAYKASSKHVVFSDVPLFDWVGALFTLLAVFVMAMKGSPWVDAALLQVLFYTAVAWFAFEVLMKIIALSPIGFFQLKRNRADLFILLVIAVAIFYEPLSIFGALAILARTVRIATMIDNTESSQKLVALVIHSLPMLVNVIILLSVMFFLFSGIAVQLFANARLGFPFDKLNNFRAMGNAALTLYQVLTAEGWVDIASACTHSAPDCVGCHTYVAYPFFIIFVIIAFIVCLQLFAVVVVEHYDDLDDCAEKKLLAAFAETRQLWREYARSTSVPISLEKLLRLTLHLPRRLTNMPLGATHHDMFLFLVKLDIQVADDLRIHFRPLVHALVTHAFNIQAKGVKPNAVKIHDAIVDPNCFTVGHLMAARIIWLHWRDFIGRKGERMQEEHAREQQRLRERMGGMDASYTSVHSFEAFEERETSDDRDTLN
jgi:hypothetical protein